VSGLPMAFFDASYPYETFRGAIIMPQGWIKRIKWRKTVSLLSLTGISRESRVRKNYISPSKVTMKMCPEFPNKQRVFNKE
jgi:hypothetical protein